MCYDEVQQSTEISRNFLHNMSALSVPLNPNCICVAKILGRMHV